MFAHEHSSALARTKMSCAQRRPPTTAARIRGLGKGGSTCQAHLSASKNSTVSVALKVAPLPPTATMPPPKAATETRCRGVGMAGIRLQPSPSAPPHTKRSSNRCRARPSACPLRPRPPTTNALRPVLSDATAAPQPGDCRAGSSSQRPACVSYTSMEEETAPPPSGKSPPMAKIRCPRTEAAPPYLALCICGRTSQTRLIMSYLSAERNGLVPSRPPRTYR
mmetsp:Transcript_14277/g.44632  ORF Transcript_14277/g.44632 Transcript_14277/m.44632 type:complete len:222 (+) Transcript_14277:1-666(+)